MIIYSYEHLKNFLVYQDFILSLINLNWGVTLFLTCAGDTQMQEVLPHFWHSTEPVGR